MIREEVIMHFLILGKGKTGSLVADVARERGHVVRALDIDDNQHASALTAANLKGVDVVIDFTAPEAAVENMRAVLALGGRIVVGTTGWYAHLDEMKSLAQKSGALLYGTNFSIAETHHTSKLDAPSGTAITLREIIQAASPGSEVPITSHRVGDAKGEHVVTASSDVDTLELRHEILSRRGLALGAVRGAEWLAQKSGAWDFREICEQL